MCHHGGMTDPDLSTADIGFTSAY
ncbi:MAG: hypothetical protein RJB51_9, partial [Actinomycetota bacterium]